MKEEGEKGSQTGRTLQALGIGQHRCTHPTSQRTSQSPANEPNITTLNLSNSLPEYTLNGPTRNPIRRRALILLDREEGARAEIGICRRARDVRVRVGLGFGLGLVLRVYRAPRLREHARACRCRCRCRVHGRCGMEGWELSRSRGGHCRRQELDLHFLGPSIG